MKLSDMQLNRVATIVACKCVHACEVKATKQHNNSSTGIELERALLLVGSLYTTKFPLLM